jgi:hypothetical protein
MPTQLLKRLHLNLVCINASQTQFLSKHACTPAQRALYNCRNSHTPQCMHTVSHCIDGASEKQATGNRQKSNCTAMHSGHASPACILRFVHVQSQPTSRGTPSKPTRTARQGKAPTQPCMHVLSRKERTAAPSPIGSAAQLGDMLQEGVLPRVLIIWLAAGASILSMHVRSRRQRRLPS